MGRRSTKTTKAGKFMNPTDQYSKQLLPLLCIHDFLVYFLRKRAKEERAEEGVLHIFI